MGRWIDHKALVTGLVLAAIIAVVPAMRSAVLGAVQWVWAAATHGVPVPVGLLAALILAAGIPVVRGVRRRRKPAPPPRRLSAAELTDLQWNCLRVLASFNDGVTCRLMATTLQANTHRVEQELARLIRMRLVMRDPLYTRDYKLAAQGRELLIAEGII